MVPVGVLHMKEEENIFLCQKLWRCGILRVGLSLIDDEVKRL